MKIFFWINYKTKLKKRAEFHLTKGPHAKQTRGKEKVRVNRASSNNYDRKRNSTVESHNRYTLILFS